jgi:hypothetical protein
MHTALKNEAISSKIVAILLDDSSATSDLDEGKRSYLSNAILRFSERKRLEKRAESLSDNEGRKDATVEKEDDPEVIEIELGDVQQYTRNQPEFIPLPGGRPRQNQQPSSLSDIKANLVFFHRAVCVDLIARISPSESECFSYSC